MQVNDILRPCPFCGNDVYYASIEIDRTGARRLEVECTCGVQFQIDADTLFYSANGRPQQVGYDAIAKWNKRAEQ